MSRRCVQCSLGFMAYQQQLYFKQFSLAYVEPSKSFQTFFVQAFRIVVDS